MSVVHHLAPTKDGRLNELSRLFLGLLLLWKQDRVDVWKNTTLGNSDRAEKLVQFLIVSDSKLDVSWDNSGFLVITGGVTSELKDLGAEILEDSGEVDRGTSPDARGGSLQVAVDASDRELEPSLTGAGLGYRLGSLLSASALALA